VSRGDTYVTSNGTVQYVSSRESGRKKRRQRVEHGIYLSGNKYIVRNKYTMFGSRDTLEEARELRDRSLRTTSS
jgi:hypothetical protein